jgi:molecular chaperone DnaK
MHLGIDLGTSNSAIFGYDSTGLRLFKSVKGADVLPSALLIDRRGGLHVGETAYEQLAYSPDRVAKGFKRLMGTSSNAFPAPDPSMSPEQASSEIIKALVGQARLAAGDFNPEGTVVTIPAAFNQMQSEATMRAAQAAGLAKVGLLQEPVAAALASIAETGERNGVFLIYDLGGGTFDVALVQSTGGHATILAHAGKNMLGGQDHDRILVDNLLRPWLLSTFSLPNNFHADPRYQRLLRIGRHFAERAKIELSVRDEVRIFADEGQIGVSDEAGSPIYFDVPFTRHDFNRLISGTVDETVALCRQVLQQNGYQPADIARIVMIGGPSRIPFVRTRTSEELGIALDLASDPMTAVAKGAAIYCESRIWSGQSSEAKPVRGAIRINGPIELRVDHPSRTPDARIRVRVRVQSNFAPGYRVQLLAQDGWTTGQIDLQQELVLNDIPLAQAGNNDFRVTVFDAAGQTLGEASTKFSVVRVGAAASGIPATQTIAVKLAKGLPGGEKNILEPIIEKGSLLPKSGVTPIRAAKDLRAGSGGSIDVELFQKPDGIDNPELGLGIGVFRILSDDLERGDVIRRGDEIFCHWSMDDSGLIFCKLVVPAISKEFGEKRVYAASIGEKNYDGPEGDALAKSLINDAEAELTALKHAIGSRGTAEVSDLNDRLSEASAKLEGAYEADTRRSAAEEARSIRNEVALIRDRPENKRATLSAELEGLQEAFEAIIRRDADPYTASQVERLFGHARDAILRGTDQSLEDAERSMREAVAVAQADLVKRPDFWVAIFTDLEQEGHLAISKAKHAALVRKGRAALDEHNVDELVSVIAEMRHNMFRTETSKRAAALASIMPH